MLKRIGYILFVFIFIVGAIYSIYDFYSYVQSKETEYMKIVNKYEKEERIVIGPGIVSSKVFQYLVLTDGDVLVDVKVGYELYTNKEVFDTVLVEISREYKRCKVIE